MMSQGLGAAVTHSEKNHRSAEDRQPRVAADRVANQPILGLEDNNCETLDSQNQEIGIPMSGGFLYNTWQEPFNLVLLSNSTPSIRLPPPSHGHDVVTQKTRRGSDMNIGFAPL